MCSSPFYLLVLEAWGGIVSTGGYVTGDSGTDFGNTNYNDHHFHFAYFILAASYIGYLDPAWLASHKDYINTMVRDTANASSEDPYFPVNRGFDWYNGHSWAKGLFESADGKDQESSAEDACFAYSLKMWGKTIGDANLEARGNLQLSVVARSISKYFLYTSDNTVQPKNFIGNKVSGILFENKIHHTTYFGANTEYIQGIHMIPLLPSSSLTRPKKFVSEEWDTFFSDDRAKKVEGGWRGILFANLALIDPKQSYSFFAQESFDNAWLDGGASRTWYMALAAGMISLGALLKNYRAKLTNIRTWRRLGSGLVAESRVLSGQGHGMLDVASLSDNPRQLKARSVAEPCQNILLYIYIPGGGTFRCLNGYGRLQCVR